MTEPADRERLKWDLCDAHGSKCTCRGHPEDTCPGMRKVAERAIALGAKPPADPVEELAKRAWDVYQRECGYQTPAEWKYTTAECQRGFTGAVRYVLDHAPKGER